MLDSFNAPEPKIGIVTVTYNSASCIEDFPYSEGRDNPTQLANYHIF